MKGDFFGMNDVHGLVGRKFYLTESVKKDFPYPEDIRIISEDVDSVVFKNGSLKTMMDKETLHRFYTTIKPDMTFAIRYITDIDIRKSLVITVNEYESCYRKGSFVTYFQCIDILGMYLKYMKNDVIEIVKSGNKNESVSALSIPLDIDHCINIPIKKDFANGVHKEKRYIVYGYKEDNLIDLFKFIDRKKWLDILRNLSMSINKIYDLGIDKNLFTTKSILGFVKQIEHMNYPICNVMNIIPDTLFPENHRGENFIKSIEDMKNGIEVYPSMLKVMETYDHGIIYDKLYVKPYSSIDPESIILFEYTEYIDIERLRIKYPKDNIILVKTMKDNKLYVIIYKTKSTIVQIAEDLSSQSEGALSKDELKTFFTKKC